VQWPYITDVVNAAIGTDYTQEDLARTAARIIDMTRDYNLSRGVTHERLPVWITGKPLQDDSGLAATADEFETLLGHYYAARGWGAPAPA
jgi:aldehyde:ferredoxin oxidoreductase